MAGHGISFRLSFSNRGDATILLPVPRITGLQFTDVESKRVCKWYTRLLVNSMTTATFVLDPAANQTFDLHARFHDSEIENSRRDCSDFFRWYTDMTVGRYAAQCLYAVDENYFDPNSHARLCHLQQDADEQNATAWTGSIASTPINIERQTA